MVTILSIPCMVGDVVSNPCDGHTCSYLCLLSSTATVGYSCACPDGSALLGNGRDCSNGKQCYNVL